MELLTVKEVASLKGCTERNIQRIINQDTISYQKIIGDNGRTQYLIPLSSLSDSLQRKWYELNGKPMPANLSKKQFREVIRKPLDSYSTDQREEIEKWIQIFDEWQSFRSGYKTKSEADNKYIEKLKADHGIKISKGGLYRKYASYKNGDLDGLIDKRGRSRKGKTEFSPELRDLFEYFFLDERALNIAKCYELMTLFIKQERPALINSLPSYDTVYRWSKDVPAPVATLARQGDKAFNDRYGIYADRFYDDMVSNDYWIADGHRIDVITKSEDGTDKLHRLTLSAFIDARSGIYTGWVVTDNPSSDATLLALRKGILKYGTPKYIYVDNGREYLNIDIGGMGHRKRKRKVDIKLPTPILTRLGIEMTNALPRNAQAKIIEREFRNFTFLSQLFPTYVGSNVVVKPEKLKANLKSGNIPTDGELISVVNDMIEGYFNTRTYNGKVISDRGLTRMEVYQKNIGTVRRVLEEDLHLMMRRSTRLQTVGRNGVYITISGEKLFYFDDELLMMQGKKVFVRYDPENMDTIRIYDENEVFIKEASYRDDMRVGYHATKDEIKHVMSEKRRWRKLAKFEGEARREKTLSQYGHINALDVYVKAAGISKEGLLANDNEAKGKVIEIVKPEDNVLKVSATGTDGKTSIIDRSRMLKNIEKHNK